MNAPVLPKTLGYDVEAVRRDFPALSLEVNGKPLCYLDNGASAQKPRHVLDAIRHAYEAEYANVHRGLHYLANAATEAYEGAREEVRAFLNAGSTDEIVFTRSATGALNLAFDVTPADLVTAIVTEARVIRPAAGETPGSVARSD